MQITQIILPMLYRDFTNKLTPYHTNYNMKCRTNILEVKQKYLSNSKVTGTFKDKNILNWNHLNELILTHINENNCNENYFKLKELCENGNIKANILLYQADNTWKQTCQEIFWLKVDKPENIYKNVLHLHLPLLSNVNVEYMVHMKIASGDI